MYSGWNGKGIKNEIHVYLFADVCGHCIRSVLFLLCSNAFQSIYFSTSLCKVRNEHLKFMIRIKISIFCYDITDSVVFRRRFYWDIHHNSNWVSVTSLLGFIHLMINLPSHSLDIHSMLIPFKGSIYPIELELFSYLKSPIMFWNEQYFWKVWIHSKLIRYQLYRHFMVLSRN